jgi:hypothetical protein
MGRHAKTSRIHSPSMRTHNSIREIIQKEALGKFDIAAHVVERCKTLCLGGNGAPPPHIRLVRSAAFEMPRS